jgi:hypothetical protein
MNLVNSKSGFFGPGEYVGARIETNDLYAKVYARSRGTIRGTIVSGSAGTIDGPLVKLDTHMHPYVLNRRLFRVLPLGEAERK